MNATTSRKPLPVQRGRNASLPLHHLLTLWIAESGKTNTEIAEALGYPRPNVVAMLKTGNMRLPLNKVAATAKALDKDPIFVLEKVLSESAPEMWDALQSVLGDRLITGNELKLLEVVRKELDGNDVDLTADKDLMDGFKPRIREIGKRETAVAKGTLDRIERDKSKRAA